MDFSAHHRSTLLCTELLLILYTIKLWISIINIASKTENILHRFNMNYNLFRNFTELENYCKEHL